MAPIDALPPDQGATLRLILRQGRSYDDLAGVLELDAAEVRRRAHAALDALAPDAARGVEPDRRAAIGDWLLGQGDTTSAERTRAGLAGSGAERAYARVVADAVAPIAVVPLPEVPGPARSRRRGSDAPPAGGEGAAAEEPAPGGEGPQRASEQRDEDPSGAAERSGGASAVPRSSKVAGAFLLAAIVALAVVGVIVLTGGDDAKLKPAASPATTTGAAATGVVPRRQINLLPPNSGSPARGVATLVTQGNQAGFIIFGQGLDPSGTGSYGIWLLSGRTRIPLGVRPVGNDGRLSAIAALPSGASGVQAIFITREQLHAGQRMPLKPGPVVLQGAIGA